MQFFVGLDLGQAQDYTALSVIERRPNVLPTHYQVRHLERFQLGTAYPAIVDRVCTLMRSPQLRGVSRLVVDATGVGRPVVDLLKKAGLTLEAVTITAGDTAHAEAGMWRVPKRDLVGVLQVMLQAKRMVIAPSLPEAETLVKELLNFQTKITLAGNDTYGAWREGSHDDLVLSVALATWSAERVAGRRDVRSYRG
ncbi:MAG: hypothetical protein M3R24_06160 [Chloroflexota bacterium]|nr:hypothetical protein [Chloroflexota bacterium]